MPSTSAHHARHADPPRRSSDLVDALGRGTVARYGLSPQGTTAVIEAAEANGLPQVSDVALQPRRADTYGVGQRSEEHTSELQSRGHLVCRLLLDKNQCPLPAVP